MQFSIEQELFDMKIEEMIQKMQKLEQKLIIIRIILGNNFYPSTHPIYRIKLFKISVA